MKFQCLACGTVHSDADTERPCDWRTVEPPMLSPVPGLHIAFGSDAPKHLRWKVFVVSDLDAVQTPDEPPPVVG